MRQIADEPTSTEALAAWIRIGEAVNALTTFAKSFTKTNG